MKPNKTILSITAILRLAVVLAIIVGLLPLSQPVQAAPAAQTGAPGDGTTGTYRGVSTAAHFDISRPLREIAADAPPVVEGVFVDTDLPFEGPLGPQDVDTAVQSEVGPGEMPAPIVSFDAISNIAGYTPPDPVGDVGPNHYVVMSNVYFAVWDKNENLLMGPLPNNSLWAGFGGPCQTENAGDPIVIYDQLADRWMLTQFSDSNPPYYNCVALSTTGDPGGTYYRWAFQTANFPDYPKYAVWPDAYYISTRESPNIGAYALNRAQMLVGNPTPQVVSFTWAESYPVGNGLLPSDIDGFNLPPAGSPNFFAGTQDDGGPMGAPFDAINLWEFHVDWVTPGNSTFTLAATLPVDPFDSIFPCSPGSRECIPQPGTSVKIDILSYRQRPLWRLAYRNFGDHEALVTNQSVEATPGMAGIRWYEIRDPNGSPFVYQQGTYAPGDGVHRWMGSIAMDNDGNMALGYSASNATSVYPSSWYTGRLAGDPLGTMPQGEGVIINGGGSQLSTGHRWGDYTSMNVDPVDDCTFWYVNEYYQTTGTSNWILRVGAFKFPSCEAPAVADVTVEKTGTPDIVLPGGDITYTITATNNGPDPILPITPTVVMTLSNATSIAILDSSPADPYPSVINAPAPGLEVVDVNVTLTDISHLYPMDMDVILVGPGGETSYLMSDAGLTYSITNATLTFDDSAANPLPYLGQITSGTYQPTNYDGGDVFPPPAPAGPYGAALSAFNGADPNGNWSLYVMDDATVSSGSIAGGWSMVITLIDPNVPPAVILTDTLPAGFTLTGMLAPNWTCTTVGQEITCTSPIMPLGPASPIEIYGTAPTPSGYITNTVEVSGTAYDYNMDNNSAEFPILVDTVPQPGEDYYYLNEDTSLVVTATQGVLANDFDPDGDPLVATLVSDVQYGTLDFNPDGSFTYMPDANFFGADLFIYEVSDGYLQAQAIAYVETMAINDAPVAQDNAYNTNEDTVLIVTAPGVLGNDSDLENDPLTVVGASAPLHGELFVALDGAGGFMYTPTLNYNGPDSFTYIVSDGTLSDTATVAITVNPVNDLPVTEAGADQSVIEGDLVSFTGVFTDPGLLLAGETFAWDFGDGTGITGTLTPTHTYVDNGVFTVTLTVTDTDGGVGTDWLVVTVDNAAPELSGFADQTLTEGDTVTITGVLTDVGILDTQTVLIEWEAGVTETLDLAAGETGFEASHLFATAGVYTVTVTLTDKDGGEAVQTFVVTVNPPEQTVWDIFLPVISNQ